MMILIMTTAMCAISSTMFLSMNPLSMGVMILLMALMLAMMFAMSMSSWLAFLIFLIYISGMLVMFSYFVALIPNQHLNFSMIFGFMTMTMMLLLIMCFILNITSPTMSFFNLQMNTMYFKMNISSLIMLAWILLFTMVVVVKLVTNNKGPLRPFMNYV